jgi:hypothetical protein
MSNPASPTSSVPTYGEPIGIVRRTNHWHHATMGKERKMTKIFADELQPGDVVEYAGRFHTVSHIARQAGWSWPIAADDTGWAMALGHHPINVLRAAA